MEYQDFNRCNVAAFGSWDYSDHDLPFTQCFESAARQAGVLLPCGYTYDIDHDLYVTGDVLYENNTMTPAVIVVPCRQRTKVVRKPQAKGAKKQEKELGYEIKVAPSPIKHRSSSKLPPPPPPPPKAVDEDLYTIPSELLYTKVPKRKRGFGLFTSCLLPICA